MTNERIRIVSLILNFTDVVSNVQVVDQSPSADEEMSIFWGSNFQCFGDSGESVGLSGIIFNVFGAQLRKAPRLRAAPLFAFACCAVCLGSVCVFLERWAACHLISSLLSMSAEVFRNFD